MRDRRSVLVAMAILIGESNVTMGAFTDLVGVVIGKDASLSKAGIKRMFVMALGPSYSHFLRYDLGVKSKDALQAFNDWGEQQPASHANLRAKFTAPPPNQVLSRRRDDDPNDDPAPLSKRPRTGSMTDPQEVLKVLPLLTLCAEAKVDWTIIGDNVDLMTKVKQLSTSNRNLMYHFFHVIASQAQTSSNCLTTLRWATRRQ
jgi:hypothetical protein